MQKALKLESFDPIREQMNFSARVLLIEDNLISQELVRSALESSCTLDIAADAKHAITLFEKNQYDLFILDLHLPDADGFDLYLMIRTVERFRDTPILFLTGRGSMEDKVRGFQLGADDYIVKPFEQPEFKARVESKLLKAQSRAQIPQDLVRMGPFEIRVGAQKISHAGPGAEPRALDLTGNQFKVLFFLMRNEDKVISRAEILKEVWGEGVHISDRTIDTHIYSIRQQLADHSGLLRSVHGKGYCFSLKAHSKRSA